MADRRVRLAVAIVVACVLAAGAVALATSGGGQPHQPTRSASPLVSLGQPIAPYRVGTPPKVGWIEMRAADPDGRHTRAVLYHTFHKVRRGRDLLNVCADVGYESQLRRLPVQPWGNCITPEDTARLQPVTWSTGTGTGEPVTMRGQVTREVRRLLLDGPGGTYDVPISRHGAFLVLYSSRARGRGTLTAHLRDGSTRFFAFALPPQFRMPGSAQARDPGGLPAWSVGAQLRPSGPRKGQTCAQFAQDTDVNAARGRTGGAFGPPMCGDLAVAPLIADAMRFGPRRTPGTFGQGPHAPRRLIVWGAVSEAVRRVAVIGPGGTRGLPLSAVGRAFITVYPRGVRPADVTIEARLSDGRVLRYRAPHLLNAQHIPLPPRLVGRVGMRVARTDRAKLVLTFSLSRPARRVEIVMRGRHVRMVRTGGARYVGVYDTRGTGLTIGIGRIYAMQAHVWYSEGRDTTLYRARLR
jgi:hypothetical protein